MVDTITSADLSDALPDVSSTLTVGSIDSDITIYRDTKGIPHIKAFTTHDAFFGQGLATAQDRLWHMERDRRVGYGRWAEVVGDEGINDDILMRKFMIKSSVEADYAALNKETKNIIEAYTLGVNTFINTTSRLPVEFKITGSHPEPWKPEDCLAVFKTRHILMGVFEGKIWRAKLIKALGPEEAAKIIPDYPDGQLLITPPGSEYVSGSWEVLDHLTQGFSDLSWLDNVDSGSNNWVLSGERTYSGKPILAGDPHRPLDTPSVYYQNHVACPDFDVIGLSFPGCPGFPHFGHNAKVAWSVTHAQADYQDLYIERFKGSENYEYEWKGDWKKSDVRQETIFTRDGDTVNVELVSTHHGPIIMGEPSSGYGISFKYTGTDEVNTWAQCLLPMLNSKNIDEMDEAMRGWVDPSNNFVFADINGDIEYLNRGRLPVRPELNRWLPVPGWSGEYEWSGNVPFEEHARSRNPDTGYIVTANNRIAPSDYPHYIAVHFGLDYRARSIKRIVEKLDNASPKDMLAIHNEIRSIPAESYLKLLEGIKFNDSFLTQGLSEFESWDGSMDRDSVGPTIYSAFRRELEWTLFEHILGPLVGEAISSGGRGAPMHLAQLRAKFIIDAINNDITLLPDGHNWRSLFTDAFSKGITWLKVTLGSDMSLWKWGKIHATKPSHTLSSAFPELSTLLDPPSVPMNGDGDTPHAASYQTLDPFQVNGLSVARYIFDLDNWGNSWWITPLGSSGHPGSSHYKDQADIWSEGDVLPMVYDWQIIKEQSETVQVISKT